MGDSKFFETLVSPQVGSDDAVAKKKKKKTLLWQMIICFLDYFKKTEKCMLGNGSPHLGGAPSRGNQITLKVYQPSFIRLSARDVPASRMQEELATLMVGINH